MLGCYGKTPGGIGRGYIYSPGRGVIGAPFESPTPVQTLDEIVLIFRRSSGLRFRIITSVISTSTALVFRLRAEKGGDDELRHPCVLRAQCAPVRGASERVLPDRGRHIKRVWKDALPIQTTCVKITRFNRFVYGRRIREVYVRRMRQKGFIAPRATDVPQLLKQAAAALGM